VADAGVSSPGYTPQPHTGEPAFQNLGSEVTLIEGGPRMLPNHEEFARVQLTTALRQDGVEILI
jgi:NADH dehydrogenase FAD-containing subunit